MIINKQSGTPRIEIGLPWTINPSYYDIRENTLPDKLNNDNYYANYRFTNMIFANLHPVDIVPIIPKVDLTEAKKYIDEINKEQQNTNFIKKMFDELGDKASELITSFLLTKFKPDYETGRNIFNYYLKDAFKIINPDDPDIHYIRVYATDNTQISESITSNYEVIEIGKAINELLNSGTDNLMDKILGLILPEQLHKPVSTLRKLFNNMYQATYYYNEGAIKGKTSMNDLLPLLLDSKQLKIDFPKRWVNTDYNRVFNLNIELSSPYGHPNAVYKWVIQPLLVLILLAAPANMYGMIGMPLYVRAKAHGLFDIPLGAIQSIIIDRGGSNTKFNIYKQPLKINVTLTIIDLYNLFSIDAYNAKQKSFNAQKQLENIIDIDKYNPENDTFISYQSTFTNFTKSFKPAKDSNYEPKSSYIKSYTIKINNDNNRN